MYDQDILIVATGPSGDAVMAPLLSGMLSKGLRPYGFAGPCCSAVADITFKSALDWREPGLFHGRLWALRKPFIAGALKSMLLRDTALVLTAGYVPGLEALWHKAHNIKIPVMHISIPVFTEPPPQSVIPDGLRVMASILPLASHYAFAGADVTLTGHPSVEPFRYPDQDTQLEYIRVAREKLELSRKDNIIGIFPGSSSHDIRRLFNIMTEATSGIRSEWGRGIPVICLSEGSKHGFNSCKDVVAEAMEGLREPRLAFTSAEKIFPICDIALAASGTIVYEAIAAGVPVVELCHSESPGIWLPQKLGIRAAGMCQMATPASRQPVFFCGRRPAELNRKDLQSVEKSRLSYRISRVASPMMIDRRKRERIRASLGSIAAALGNTENIYATIESAITKAAGGRKLL